MPEKGKTDTRGRYISFGKNTVLKKSSANRRDPYTQFEVSKRAPQWLRPAIQYMRRHFGAA